MNKHNLKASDFILDTVVSIELLGDRKTVDITVDDTHLFFANDVYSHNSSLEEDIIGGEKISEAFSKLMVSDFVMSFSRKVQDKVAGTGRFHIIKNRFGPDGMTFPAKVNTSVGTIQMFEESTAPGKETKKEMDKGNEYLRILLRKKRDEMRDDENRDKNKFSGFEGEDDEPTVLVPA